MSARVKGKARNALARLPSRPSTTSPVVDEAGAGPEERRADLQGAAGALAAAQPVFPGLPLRQVGLAMINCVRFGAPRGVLEAADSQKTTRALRVATGPDQAGIAGAKWAGERSRDRKPSCDSVKVAASFTRRRGTGRAGVERIVGHRDVTSADVVTLRPPPVKVAGTLSIRAAMASAVVRRRSENASEAPFAWSTIVTSTRRQTNTTGGRRSYRRRARGVLPEEVALPPHVRASMEASTPISTPTSCGASTLSELSSVCDCGEELHAGRKRREEEAEFRRFA